MLEDALACGFQSTGGCEAESLYAGYMNTCVKYLFHFLDLLTVPLQYLDCAWNINIFYLQVIHVLEQYKCIAVAATS